MSAEPKVAEDGTVSTPGAVDFFRVVNAQVSTTAPPHQALIATVLDNYSALQHVMVPESATTAVRNICCCCSQVAVAIELKPLLHLCCISLICLQIGGRLPRTVLGCSTMFAWFVWFTYRPSAQSHLGTLKVIL